MKIILASKSPRRLQLLQAAGLTVEVMPSHVDETPLVNETVQQMVQRLCKEKAEACPVNDRPIIAADTLVSLHDQALGQPVDLAEAKEMLQRLSGQHHQVLTSVCVRLGEFMVSDMIATDVLFRPITNKELDIYLAHNDVLDKAGAYAIQAGASSFIESIHGPLDNVIGLPVQVTLALIKEVKSMAA
ncbi:MAG: Maf family protein [Mariprofundaceae bacterium]